MRARADIDESLNPWQAVDQVYTPEFLAGCGKRFAIDFSDKDAVWAVRETGARYILARRLEESPVLLKDERGRYLALAEALDHFRAELKGVEEIVVNDMFHAAREMREPKPATDFPHLSDHEKKRGQPYYCELQRMLEILRTAIRGQIGKLTSRGGRPKNEGLDLFMYYAADFWVGELGRRFSIDHHKGVGLTEAFEFSKFLLTPLDDVSDAQIVTAMRRQIRERRAHNIPT